MPRREPSTASFCISWQCAEPTIFSRFPRVPSRMDSGRIARDHGPGHRVTGGRHGELAELFRQRHGGNQLIVCDSWQNNAAPVSARRK